METALAFLIPEADPVVADFRARHDSSAAEGMSAHVTVLVPFAQHDAIDASTLRTLIAETAPFDLVFARSERFPGTLWLAPEPAEPIAALTERLTARFPDYPPYGGQFPVVIPHLTVAQGADAVLDTVAAALAPRLPFRTRVERCTLFAHAPGRWHEIESFPLGR